MVVVRIVVDDFWYLVPRLFSSDATGHGNICMSTTTTTTTRSSNHDHHHYQRQATAAAGAQLLVVVVVVVVVALDLRMMVVIVSCADAHRFTIRRYPTTICTSIGLD